MLASVTGAAPSGDEPLQLANGAAAATSASSADALAGRPLRRSAEVMSAAAAAAHRAATAIAPITTSGRHTQAPSRVWTAAMVSTTAPGSASHAAVVRRPAFL